MSASDDPTDDPKPRHPKAPPIPPYPGLEVLEDEVVYGGRFAMQRVRFTHQRFDGTRSGELVWELWRRGNGVLVLPYDPVSDRVALIEQFRLPALASGNSPIMTECPAGLLEPTEPPDAAGQRELTEETGLVARHMEPMGNFLLMQGGCDEVLHFFCADVRLPQKANGATHGLAQEHEDTRLRLVTAEEAFGMVATNAIENAPCALALLWLQVNRPRLRAAWS
jgi:ADP-ribose pyrophosphatase